uniref:Uncharacterized protein n=1 Tax=Meleagris gallopavo TaxID=9103 RepID=A0A803XPL5_MELGA
MARRTKPEVERYVAFVQSAASSPREVSAVGRPGPPAELLRWFPCDLDVVHRP